MVLFLGIAIVISIFAVVDWKHTVLAWLPVSMLFNPCVCIRYAPPALTVVLAVNFVLLAVYFLKEMRKSKVRYPFMFRKSFVVYLISYFFSMLFSILPFTTAVTGTIQYFMNTFVVVFLFHKALETQKDISYFVKTALIVFIPIVALGLFEAIFHDNPWLDLVFLSSPNADFVEGKMYYIPPFLSLTGDLGMRYGMVRCYSFFMIHIAFGCACVLYMYMFLYFQRQQLGRCDGIKSVYYSVVVFLCLIGIILCNSKTPFVGVFFFVMSVFPMKQLFSGKSFVLILGLIAIGTIALSYNEGLFDNFIALFNKDKMEEGGGSTTDMRANQFAIAFDMFMNNPLFGNGINTLSTLRKSNAEIYGAESSWMSISIQQGLLGLVAYLILYKEIYDHMVKSVVKRDTFFYLSGLILMESVTGVMVFSVFAPTLVAIERYSQLRKMKIVRLLQAGVNLTLHFSSRRKLY